MVLSSHLTGYTGGRNEIELRATASVGTLIGLLDVEFPGISQRLLDDQGEVRKFVNIFLDDEDIRERDGVNTSLSGVKEVVILPSIAGG